MFHELVSRNEDLRRLVDKGYAVKFDSGHLVVRDVPYLDKDKNLRTGALVTKLVFVDKVQVKQQDHQVFFCGAHPHNADGTPIPNLGGGAAQLTLTDASLVVERQFSNKPLTVNGTHDPNGFPDFFAKIESYTQVISGPAQQLHPSANPLTFRVDKDVTTGSVFRFHDTLTSRAEIGDLAKKLHQDVVAIIGLGGTGAYLLDFMVKTPVKEIRAFDRDASTSTTPTARRGVSMKASSTSPRPRSTSSATRTSAKACASRRSTSTPHARLSWRASRLPSSA